MSTIEEMREKVKRFDETGAASLSIQEGLDAMRLAIQLHDSELSRQSVTDDEVQRAIDWIENFQICWVLSETHIAVTDTILAALSAYRKPTADQAEIDRAIAIIERDLTMNGAYPDKPCHCDHCKASRLAITALRRMAGDTE